MTMKVISKIVVVPPPFEGLAKVIAQFAHFDTFHWPDRTFALNVYCAVWKNVYFFFFSFASNIKSGVSFLLLLPF